MPEWTIIIQYYAFASNWASLYKYISIGLEDVHIIGPIPDLKDPMLF